MSFIDLSIKHGQSPESARERLRTSVTELSSRFGGMIERTDWSADGSGVKVLGKGFNVDMRVDAEDLHVSGNLTFLGGLLAKPLAAGLKQILQKTFPKQLT